MVPAPTCGIRRHEEEDTLTSAHAVALEDAALGATAIADAATVPVRVRSAERMYAGERRGGNGWRTSLGNRRSDVPS